MNLVVISRQILECIEVHGLLAVGGSKSSGKAVPGLKYPDDYLLATRSGPDEFTLHPLVGKKRGPLKLKAGEVATFEDLTVGILERDSTLSPHDAHSASPLMECIGSFALSDDLAEPMRRVLATLLEETSMEKGLIIARNPDGKYTVAAFEGLDRGEPWISESLVQETLKSQLPVSIQNLFGSRFENNRSIMGTGFLSVHTWPLVVRGDALGVILVGSTKPHSGLSEPERAASASLAHVAALMLWFQLREKKLKEEINALKSAQAARDDVPLATGFGPLLETVETARKVAPTFLSVFVHGETGVGKELLARWLHQKSDRAGAPFVAVNCGAIPSELLESLLFGHKKGSFTGAHSDQAGKFQLADGGTLFLDEIGDLPQSLQVKLLRALQERAIEPLGSARPVKVDVRVISASHKNLPRLVDTGQFREDLYYRLAEVTLSIPALRERPEDVTLLSTQFLKDLAPEKRFSTKAWNWLKAQTWPGNARELYSAVKRAAVLSREDEITVEDLTTGQPRGKASAENSRNWLGGKDLEEAKNAFVREKVKQALARAGGHRQKAAELLGVAPRTLFRYLEDSGENNLPDLSSQ